jgi:hypothetical protein
MNPTPALPANEWDTLLGPFYLVTDVARWIGVSTRVVRYRIATRQLIGLKTTDRILLPSFQFNEHREAPKRLREVLTAMDPPGIDPWGDAALLRERRKELGDRSLIEALRAGQYGEVLALATELGEVVQELVSPQLAVRKKNDSDDATDLTSRTGHSPTSTDG